MARGCQRLWLRWNEARTIAAVNETKRASSGWKVGCIVTAIVLGVLGFCCGGTLLGTTFWASRNPTLRRGFAIVGGAIELAREGQNQPGAAQMRSAGCVSAFVLTPELLRRFVALLPDAGPGGGGVPQYPMIVCGAGRARVWLRDRRSAGRDRGAGHGAERKRAALPRDVRARWYVPS
jgi:hypothetical protein